MDPNHGVLITPLTYIYLGDVLDHCVLITETLNQLKNSADGMIGLIFNTISATQNESMRQLTTATIIFLPLTFITGYFGQNFQPFTVLQEDIGYLCVPSLFLFLWTATPGPSRESHSLTVGQLENRGPGGCLHHHRLAVGRYL